MSCNRNETKCAFCGSEVCIVGPILSTEEYGFHKEYSHYVSNVLEPYKFAKSRCGNCGAPYTGWIGPLYRGAELEILDTSHRHSFNDEPDKERDMPVVPVYSEEELQERAMRFEQEAES